MLQTGRTEKVDEKNGVICLVSMFSSRVMVLRLDCLKKYVFKNFELTAARNFSLLKQFTYTYMKDLVTHFQKWYCLLCYDLLFRIY